MVNDETGRGEEEAVYKTLLKLELARTCLRWQFGAALLAFMAVFMHIVALNKADIPSHSRYPIMLMLENSNPFKTYVSFLGGRLNSYFVFVFPLIVMLICGDSLYMDYKTKYIHYCFARLSLRDYMRGKLLEL